MNLADISKLGVKNPFKQRYDNFIGGKFVAPIKGEYFANVTPITGQPFCEIARSTAEDIELALDAAHAAKDAWGKTSPAERANILNKIADRMEANLELIATAETIDNGKPIRETMAADIPLAIDHFRYFAGCIRAQEGSVSQIDSETYAYHFHEPLGVVGQIIPWNFPILMAVWKLAPALAAGNCVVMKPAEQTPASIMVLMEVIGDLLPPGVLNIVNGFGLEAGKPLASNKRIAKIAFTGETGTGRLIMQYAAQNLIPVTLELGGKSPNIFFAYFDILDDFAAGDIDHMHQAGYFGSRIQRLAVRRHQHAFRFLANLDFSEYFFAGKIDCNDSAFVFIREIQFFAIGREVEYFRPLLQRYLVHHFFAGNIDHQRAAVIAAQRDQSLAVGC